jgi:hypothetical protein
MNTLNPELAAQSKWQKLNVAYVLLTALHDELPAELYPSLDCWLTAMEDARQAPDADPDTMGTWLNKICRLANTDDLYRH